MLGSILGPRFLETPMKKPTSILNMAPPSIILTLAQVFIGFRAGLAQMLSQEKYTPPNWHETSKGRLCT